MVTVRDMSEEYFEDYRRMAMDFYSGDATLFPMDEEKLRATMAEAASGKPMARLLAIFQQSRMIGYMELALTFSTEAGGRVCWIEELYILPEYRGQGIGTQALNWCLEEYAEYARIRLEVVPDQEDDIRLYRRLGFRDIGYTSMVIDRGTRPKN